MNISLCPKDLKVGAVEDYLAEFAVLLFAYLGGKYKDVTHISL